MDRRNVLAAMPLLALAPGLSWGKDGEGPNESKPVFLSPPVVQQATTTGFTVSIEVSRLCIGRVEWGWAADALTNVAVATHHGLVDANDRCLVIPVHFAESATPGRPVFYRVVAQTLDYANAYKLTRGTPVSTAVRKLLLPHAQQEKTVLAVVNDTHENQETLAALTSRLEFTNPDLLIWNGDTCNDFDGRDNPAAILLRPGASGNAPSDGGWASTRSLFVVPGNHDVRGEQAREVVSILAAGPHPQLPYNTAMRIGPLALIGLDTGEDKPDKHPVFAGTAAYEPHRARQAVWLKEQLSRPEIADAPFKVAFCHIPLRGLAGQPDGTTLEGYARFSGQGAKLWLPQLTAAGFRAVVSGHTHQWRSDKPTTDLPISQIVGGGPKPSTATLIVIEATAKQLTIRIEDLAGKPLVTESWDV